TEETGTGTPRTLRSVRLDLNAVVPPSRLGSVQRDVPHPPKRGPCPRVARHHLAASTRCKVVDVKHARSRETEVEVARSAISPRLRLRGFHRPNHWPEAR